MDNYKKAIEYIEKRMLDYGKKYPTQAAALLSGHRCPYTKYLIEAFCFIASDIENQNDDNLNKLAQQLVEIICPHYLYPQPSSVILEFIPKDGFMKTAKTIKKGTQVSSVSISGFPCKFTTSTSVIVRPLNISNVEKNRNDTHDTLQLVLKKNNQTKWCNVGKEPLSIHLHGGVHGEHRKAFYLYYNILKKVKNVSVTWNNFTKNFSPDVFQPAIRHMDDDYFSSLYPKFSFKSFRLFQNYFHFYQSLLFIELDIFSKLNIPDEISEITVNVDMEYNDIIPRDFNFRLNCVPAINLFDDEESSESINFDNSKTEHEIEINESYKKHRFPIFVNHVTGAINNERFEYKPFVSYRHELDDKNSGYYFLRRKYDEDEQSALFIQIVRSKKRSKVETVSLNLKCSNCSLASLLGPGDINTIDSKGLDFVNVKNITIPTEPVYPKIEGKELWTLINSLSLNYLSIANVDYLKKMLLLFEPKNDIANQMRINGIDSVELLSEPVRKIMKGGVVHGQLMNVYLNSKNFTNIGDMLVFSEIFSNFISMYISINSFCILRVIEKNKKEIIYECQITGERNLL